MKPRTILYSALLALCATGALAAEPVAEATISFANLGGINDWRADGDRALYVQGRNQKWYHAELMGSCIDLPNAERIGFVVEPAGSFDRFSSIIVRGRQCMLRSLTESDAPQSRKR